MRAWDGYTVTHLSQQNEHNLQQNLSKCESLTQYSCRAAIHNMR